MGIREGHTQEKPQDAQNTTTAMAGGMAGCHVGSVPMAAPVALQPPKGASYDSALLQEGILKPPALRVVEDWLRVFRTAEASRCGYSVCQARQTKTVL